MTDCVFCRILRGEIPAQLVYDGPRAFAILDINPVSWGHTLVIPRDHFETWNELPADLAAELAKAAQVVARGVVKASGAEGFNLLMNNHRCSGQAIAHAHFHVIPRKTGDEIKYQWKTKPYDPGVIEKVGSEVRAALQIK